MRLSVTWKRMFVTSDSVVGCWGAGDRRETNSVDTEGHKRVESGGEWWGQGKEQIVTSMALSSSLYQSLT